MKHEEHLIQCAISQFLRYQGIFFFAVPNGEKRSVTVGARLKKEGVLAGCSDLVILFPERIIFVEVKTSKRNFKIMLKSSDLNM